MGTHTTAQGRTKKAVMAVSQAAESLKTHAEQVSSAAHVAAVSGIGTVRDAVSSGALHDATEQVKHAAAPLGEAAQTAARQVAEQARHTAGTLTARTYERSGNVGGRSWPVRILVAAACAVGAGAMLWGWSVTARRSVRQLYLSGRYRRPDPLLPTPSPGRPRGRRRDEAGTAARGH
ncbi:hypothetical protein [Streptacidiphilus neutrinimicus]|uniref:hypothetical protein n=1 Tax=Streptacidiphilus neutrinimicus TaxID=105420 RepID=UPI0005A7107B|nr:hypothetical protein [Streptacidiphilus neutrinimicus]